MAYNISKAFKRIEEELIASIMRNLDHHRAQETDEGFLWTQWQAEQLSALTRYRKENQKKYGPQFAEINKKIPELIKLYRNEGNMDQEAELLEAAAMGADVKEDTGPVSAKFFGVNDRKMDALAKATTNDLQKAEHAVLRKAEDDYRQIIYDAQVYANAGGTTYEKAVDMATKDFLARGIQCIEYSNGAKHTISDYADMAIKTATKRAYLTGEGEMRNKWGEHLVIINKRTDACPKCMPFAGKIMIDDVWSGGTAEDGPYPLLSTAIEAGLYHPRCRDSHTTYFPGISTPPEGYTKEELAEKEAAYDADQKQKAAEKAAEKYDRMAEHSLDSENKIENARKAESRHHDVSHNSLKDDADYQERIKKRREEYIKRKSKSAEQPPSEVASYKECKPEYDDLRAKRKQMQTDVESLEAKKKAEELKVIMDGDAEAMENAKSYAEKIRDIKTQLDPIEERLIEIQRMAAREISKEMMDAGIADKVFLSEKMTIDSMETVQATLDRLINEQGLPPLKGVKYDPKYIAFHGGKGTVATYDWVSETMNIGPAINDPEGFAERCIAREKAFSERQGSLKDLREKYLADKEKELAEAIASGDKGTKAMRTSEINDTLGELSQTRQACVESVEDVIAHEYGHHVHNKASGGIKDIYGKKELGARKIEGVWHWKADNAGKAIASEVSYYGASNPLEAFAESFVAKQKGIHIPESLESVVDGAVRKVVVENATTEVADIEHLISDFEKYISGKNEEVFAESYSLGVLETNDVLGDLSGKTVKIDNTSLKRIMIKHGNEMRSEEVGLVSKALEHPDVVADNSDRHPASYLLYSRIPDRDKYVMEIAVVPKNEEGFIIHFHKIKMKKVRSLRGKGKILIDRI